MPGWPVKSGGVRIQCFEKVPESLRGQCNRAVQAGVRWEQADAAAAVAANNGRSVKGLRDAAIVAVMSDAMLRVSEAAALHVADLEAEGGNTLTVRRSKTDQEGEGVARQNCTGSGWSEPNSAQP